MYARRAGPACPRLSAAYGKTLPVIVSRKRANTFFSFGFAFLLMMPQSTEIVSLGLTTLFAVEGDQVRGEFIRTRFVTSVKFFADGLFVFLIFPARQAEHGVSLSRSLKVPCCMCNPMTCCCVLRKT